MNSSPTCSRKSKAASDRFPLGPHNASFVFDGLEVESILIGLDMAGIMASSRDTSRADVEYVVQQMQRITAQLHAAQACAI